MEYPKDPTVLPSAQRHTEIYNADQGRTFSDNDIISIQIPPTNHTYLTKDAQLHFDFDMEYYEGTDANYKEIAGNLSFDNQRIEIPLGLGTMTLTGGTADSAGTYGSSVLETQHDSIEILIARLNALNTSKSVKFYYDDSTNKVTAVYGLRITSANNTLEYLLGSESTTRTATLYEDLYTYNKSTVPGTTITGFAQYVSSLISDGSTSLGLVYNGSIVGGNYGLETYSFESTIPFTISLSSQALMTTLGFTQAPTALVGWVAVYNSGSKNYQVVAASPVKPNSTTALTVMTDNANLSRILFFNSLPATGTPPFNFSLFTSAMEGIQYYTGLAISNIVPKYDPKTFFTNLIYREQTGGEDLDPLPISPEVYRPSPTLDVNGPYGFFNSLEVYDYLGNTLLEKIPQHDLLTAIWADLESSTETTQQIIRPRMINPADDVTISKPNCSYLVKGNYKNIFKQSPYTNSSLTDYTEETITAAKITLPKITFGINLYSFLGKLSEKFVPLHNGFTIKFFINRRENVIAFNTQQPSNLISYKLTRKIADTDITPPNADPRTFYTYMKPLISKYAISNVCLRADIVTVPAELDSRIDKIVFAKGYKTQVGIPQNKSQRINTDVKSLTSVIIVQQAPAVTTNLSTMRFSAFIRNYCYNARLLYNKAVVSSVSTFEDAYRNFRNVFGCTWDEYVQRENWEIDTPLTDSSWMQTRMLDKNALSQMRYVLNSGVINNGQPIDPFYVDASMPYGPLPRYLLCFDTRLPGYTPMAVCGIDTRKQLLEVQFDTTTNTNQSAKVTMISEFDTFIEIKPSESTAVSF